MRKGSANYVLPLMMLLISAVTGVPSFFDVALPLLARSISAVFLAAAALLAERFTVARFYYVRDNGTLSIHSVRLFDRVVMTIPVECIEKQEKIKNRTFSPFVRLFSRRDFCVNAYPEYALAVTGTLGGKDFRIILEAENILQ